MNSFSIIMSRKATILDFNSKDEIIAHDISLRKGSSNSSRIKISHISFLKPYYAKTNVRRLQRVKSHESAFYI